MFLSWSFSLLALQSGKEYGIVRFGAGMHHGGNEGNKDLEARDIIWDQMDPPQHGGGCFAGTSLVILENGDRKKMSDLHVGDSVLTKNTNNNLVFSPIILHLHRSPQKRKSLLYFEP